MCDTRLDPYDLLEQVRDKETFIQFVRALASERDRAYKIEGANPKTYIINGALGWENLDISNFLYAALEYFKSGLYHQSEQMPSWKMLAEFLYFGKIYE